PDAGREFNWTAKVACPPLVLVTKPPLGLTRSAATSPSRFVPLIGGMFKPVQPLLTVNVMVYGWFPFPAMKSSTPTTVTVKVCPAVAPVMGIVRGLLGVPP